MSKSRFPVSLVIITLNEADGIARAIQSASFCDDIVVLDSGSTDGTREIAAALGARVFNEKWLGFQAMKQRATDLAQNDWVLSLDGDEAVHQDLREELVSLFASWDSQAPLVDGYRMPRLTWNLGRWIRHGGWYPDLQLRLFNRTRAKWGGGGHVHERIEAEKVERLRGVLLHYPFKTIGTRDLAPRSSRGEVSGSNAISFSSSPCRSSLRLTFLSGVFSMGFRDLSSPLARRTRSF